MNIIFDRECLNYKERGHPESPERVKAAYDFLKQHFTILAPEPVTEEDLRLVHSARHIDKVKTGNFFDFDSPTYENIFHYASLSAGAAVKAREVQGFSIMRPPGHHSGKNYLGGFCYFNNLAVAVKKSGLKTLIVDFDAHHGNGTEDIFLGDPQVVYISLHRSGIFPGTGHGSRQNIFNFPLTRNTGDEKYLETLTSALQGVGDMEFEQLAVSAGFDGYSRDPLASLSLSTEVYGEIGRILGGLNLPTFSVLEGGYVVSDLGPNILSYLNGLKK